MLFQQTRTGRDFQRNALPDAGGTNMNKETLYPVQRNYKDTLFRMIFSDKEALLSLYNAISEKDYKDPDELEIVTLENAIYMNKKNDLAFLRGH